jgi:hypothetical protein
MIYIDILPLILSVDGVVPSKPVDNRISDLPVRAFLRRSPAHAARAEIYVRNDWRHLSRVDLRPANSRA